MDENNNNKFYGSSDDNQSGHKDIETDNQHLGNEDYDKHTSEKINTKNNDFSSDYSSNYNKFYNTHSQSSEADYEKQIPLRPNYQYNNHDIYTERNIVTTVEPRNIETPTNYNTQNSDYDSDTKTKEKKVKSGGFFTRVVTFALVAVIAGSAGGSATYMYMKNNEETPQNSIVKEADNSGSNSSNITNTNNSPGTGSVTDVVKKAADSVVEITTSIEQQNPFVGSYIESGAGSGVIVSEDGYIVTNNHVIKDATSVIVRTSDGKEYEAELIGTDKETDLAVLKIDATGLKAVTIANSDEILVGELAVAIGNPLGTLGGTVTEGVVSAKDRKIQIDNEVMTLLQTSAAVNPGNSGGGLFNGKGQLIGIVNAKSSGEVVEGLGFAIPSNLVKEVVDDIVEKGYVSGRPRLGIQVVDITTPEEALKYRVDGEGVYIAKNEGDSDLRVGDRIDKVNGQDISVNSEIKDALKNFKAGDTVELTITRDGSEMSVSVLLSESIPEGK